MILFICTGNTCRSPLAAAMAQAMGFDAQSAGLCAREGDAASAGARRAAKRRGLDLSQHSARQVTMGMLHRADAVFAMTQAHADALISAFPEEKNKIHVLSPAVSDPYGGGDDRYEQCAWDLEDALKRCLPARKERL